MKNSTKENKKEIRMQKKEERKLKKEERKERRNKNREEKGSFLILFCIPLIVGIIGSLIFTIIQKNLHRISGIFCIL